MYINGSKCKVPVASIMEIQVSYVRKSKRSVRYMYYNDRTKKFGSKI